MGDFSNGHNFLAKKRCKMVTGHLFPWIMIELVLTVEAPESPPNNAVIMHNVESNILSKIKFCYLKSINDLRSPS
jgi:hypothetical protein